MIENIDLLLVNPSNKQQIYGEIGSLLSAVEPPLWTGLIAAFIRKEGFSVKIIDADAEGFTPEYTVEKIVELNPLLVGISAIGANPSASSTPKMASARMILNIIKKKPSFIRTFLYGIHPSALPERTLKEEQVDFICRGECFYTILKLLEILKSNEDNKEHEIAGLWYKKNGNIVPGGWGELIADIDNLPFTAWDLLPMGKYRAHNWHCFGNIEQRQPYAIIYTSLGCPFNCAYCNIHALYNGKPCIRFRSLNKVVDELDFLVKNYNVKNIKILDELFAFKESRVMEFCDLIIQRGYNLNMWAYARIDTVNEKMLSKMKQAGIHWLCYGIESGNNKVREGIVKGQFGQNKIKEVIEMTHRVGIHVMGNFMFGLPEDNFETMQETLNMAKELNCEFVNFYVVMAYPGSKLYEDALRNSVELPENWSDYSQLSEDTLPLPTEYLSSEDILSFRDRAFKEYYSSPRYLGMIEDKFGSEAVKHIRQILKFEIKRKLLVSTQ